MLPQNQAHNNFNPPPFSFPPGTLVPVVLSINFCANRIIRKTAASFPESTWCASRTASPYVTLSQPWFLDLLSSIPPKQNHGGIRIRLTVFSTSSYARWPWRTPHAPLPSWRRQQHASLPTPTRHAISPSSRRIPLPTSRPGRRSSAGLPRDPRDASSRSGLPSAWRSTAGHASSPWTSWS